MQGCKHARVLKCRGFHGSVKVDEVQVRVHLHRDSHNAELAQAFLRKLHKRFFG